MDDLNLYHDIEARTNGEIYLGIVGPVRTGKSTFIKRFMELLVLPNMENSADRERTMDEMPQSASGKTIMTMEPKFIPKTAPSLHLNPDVEVKMRLIDCVGFMVNGAQGHEENEEERMVKTPWFDYEIPFTKAAEVGTRKVITDHATIGIVVSTDGTIGEIPRESYIEAEEHTVQELKQLGKPFVMLLNSTRPYSAECTSLAAHLEEQYKVTVLPVNCQQLQKEDILKILEKILYEFPVSKMEMYMNKWVEFLPKDHLVKTELVRIMREFMEKTSSMKEVQKVKEELSIDHSLVRKLKMEKIDMAKGVIQLFADIDDCYYYEMLSQLTGTSIDSEYQLIGLIKELSEKKDEYDKARTALVSVRQKGYGVIMPELNEIELDEPAIIKHGNKFGVRIKANSPSIHMIRANIETEIAPIVGSEQQAQDLIRYIQENSGKEDGIWNTNIFGKTIEQLVEDGICGKIALMTDECQMKLQETMQKIVNDSNGGMVCIII